MSFINCPVRVLLYNKMESYCRALYNIGWCYGMMMLEEKDCQKKSIKDIAMEPFNNPIA